MKLWPKKKDKATKVKAVASDAGEILSDVGGLALLVLEVVAEIASDS